MEKEKDEDDEEDEETLLLEAMFQYVDGMEDADSLERGVQIGVVGAVLGVFSHRQINLQALLPHSLRWLPLLRGEAREGEGLAWLKARARALFGAACAGWGRGA